MYREIEQKSADKMRTKVRTKCGQISPKEPTVARNRTKKFGQSADESADKSAAESADKRCGRKGLQISKKKKTKNEVRRGWACGKTRLGVR